MSHYLCQVKIHHSIPTEILPHAIVTMGTFDGIHLGHQALIQTMVKEAREKEGCSILLTFNPHPKQVLYPDSEPLKMIQTLSEKTNFLKNTGLDHLIILPFTIEMSRWSAEDFTRNVFVKGLNAQKIFMGYDHRFGKNRTGDFALMQSLSELYHFEIAKLSAVHMHALPISSTKIRSAIEYGEIKKANEMLGRPFSIQGTVIHGKKIGRTIQVPTANLGNIPSDKILPKNGVYIGKAKIDGQGNYHYCAINIGLRPTVNQDLSIHIEAHLLNFNEDIYDKNITLEWLDRIRDEVKFSSFEELVLQIKKDIEWVRQYSESL